MASFLGNYPGAATQRDKKFIRAVKSFINQTHQDKELIIVADGCPLTVQLYEENFKNYENIKLIQIPKQELYSGIMRNVAYNIAEGDLICYLDNDDVIAQKHLETIANQFPDDCGWVYYDDFMVLNKEFTKLYQRVVYPRYASIGTSSICHKNFKKNNINLSFTSGYGHDFIFMMKLNAYGLKFKKLENPPKYIVCHYGGGADF